MSNKRKLNQRDVRTPQQRQGRGRHREPGTSIAGLVAIPGHAGAKILAAGALGSAAMMLMQPGASAVAAGATAPGVAGATLTANLSAIPPQGTGNQAQGSGGQNTGGGISTNSADLVGIPARGPAPLPQATPGNPSLEGTLTVPFLPNGGLGLPSFGIQGSISPANVNNDSLFGLGPRNSVGGAIPFSLNSSTFGQSPTATQPTFTKPTLDQILADDPVLKQFVDQAQTPAFTFDPQQLPTVQQAFPLGAVSSLTPADEIALQQQINQVFGGLQGQNGQAAQALTPQQMIDQAFSTFQPQNGQAAVPALGQELTPQQMIDQAFSAIQAQNGQSLMGNFGNLLSPPPNVIDPSPGIAGVRSSNDLGSLIQVADQAQPGQPQIRNEAVTVIDENGNAKDLPVGSGQGQFSIDNPAIVNPGTVVPLPGGGTGTLQPGDGMIILPNPSTGFPGLKIMTPQAAPQGDNSNGTGNPVQVTSGDPLQAFAAAGQDKNIAASLTPQDQVAALPPPGQQPSPAPAIPAFADMPAGAAVSVVDTPNGPAVQYDPGGGKPVITFDANQAVPIGNGQTLVKPGTDEFGSAPILVPNPNFIPQDQTIMPRQEAPAPIPVPPSPDPNNMNPFEPPTGNDNTRFAMNTGGSNTAQDQPPAPAPAPAPVPVDQPPAPAPAPVPVDQPPAPAPVVQTPPTMLAGDPGSGDPGFIGPPAPPVSPAPPPIVLAGSPGGIDV